LILAGCAFAVVGWVRPSWLRWLFVGWMILAFPIGWTISQLLIGSMFYLVITPVALVFRVMGRDVLRRKRGKSDPTLWNIKVPPDDSRRYLREY